MTNRSLAELPIDCLALITAFLPAKDVCRLSSVCRALQVIADSDDVWKRKVAIFTPPVTSLKQMYLQLRSGMLQRHWSDPSVTQGSFFLRARRLAITWGNDERYWKWNQEPSSWFGEVAHLESVCWLEIRGNVRNAIFRPGVYMVSLRIMLCDKRRFQSFPVKLRLSTSHGQNSECERFLQRQDQPARGTEASQRSVGGEWMELDVGEFSVETEMLLSVEFSLMGTEGYLWKSGLVVDCMKIHVSTTI